MILILKTVDLADGLSNLLAVDVGITLCESSLEELVSTIFLVPDNITSVADTHLNLIGCQSIIAVVRLRPRKVHLIVGRQLNILAGQR